MPAKMPRRACLVPILRRLIRRVRTANACYKEVAEIAGLLDQFDRAIEKFEYVGDSRRLGSSLNQGQVAQASLGSNLTRYSVKEYYFKAGLCHLCRGVRRQRH
jgi:alpha-soluble NSF attachment protein